MGHRNCARQHGLHSTECDFKRIHQEGASHPIIIPELTKKKKEVDVDEGGGMVVTSLLAPRNNSTGLLVVVSSRLPLRPPTGYGCHGGRNNLVSLGCICSAV